MRSAIAISTALGASLGWPASSAANEAAFGGGLPELAIDARGTIGEWPFAVEQGTLTCVEVNGQKVVLFSEPWPEDAGGFGNMKLPRNVIVSVNPFALLASIEDRALYRPFDSLETLIRRLAPYEAKGRELCEGQEI